MSDIDVQPDDEEDDTDRSLFRSMARHQDDTPVIGPRDLGVRDDDLQPDQDGLAQTQSGGMSVAPDDPMNLPIFRRPPSLAGTGKKPVWAISEGAIGPSLSFRQDSATHGMIEPADVMPWESYLDALADTGPAWKLSHE